MTLVARATPNAFFFHLVASFNKSHGETTTATNANATRAAAAKALAPSVPLH
jgi:hypothetical protein